MHRLALAEREVERGGKLADVQQSTARPLRIDSSSAILVATL